MYSLFSYNVGPPSYKLVYVHPMNTIVMSTINHSPLTIVMSTINHSYWSYVHQVSYLTGAPYFPSETLGKNMMPLVSQCCTLASFVKTARATLVTLFWNSPSNDHMLNCPLKAAKVIKVQLYQLSIFVEVTFLLRFSCFSCITWGPLLLGEKHI